MRLAANGAPVVVKLLAVETANKVKILPVFSNLLLTNHTNIQRCRQILTSIDSINTNKYINKINYEYSHLPVGQEMNVYGYMHEVLDSCQSFKADLCRITLRVKSCSSLLGRAPHE